MHKSLTILTLIAALVAGVLTASPAGASFYNLGVKSVDFHAATDACVPDLFACTPNAGVGMSNRLYVTQVESGGGYAFGDHDTTSAFGDGHLWLAATIGAECRVGYKLESAGILSGWIYQNGSDKVPGQLSEWSTAISVPDAKTMPPKLVALNVPMSIAFGDLGVVHEFGTIDDVYAYGESVVAQRMSAGMSEADARSQGFIFDANLALSAKVWCTPNGAGRDRFKTMPRYLPLTIEFVGVPKPGVQDQAVGGGLAVAPRVTEVGLTVTPSPSGECLLHVSPEFQADADLTAYYRLIDKYGQRSNAFAVEIEAGAITVRSHHIPIPTAETGNDGPSLVAPTGPGEIGGLVVEDIGKVTGTFRVEVYSPNLVYSDYVGFSVDPCPVPPTAEAPDPLPLPPAPDGGTVTGGGSTPDPTPPPTRQPGGLTLG